MKAKVTANLGNIFEGGADLTVLPCGAKPTWTHGVTVWIDKFGLPTPKDLADQMRLGDVTAPVVFPGPPRLTRFIAYAASVLNDKTDAKAIRKIGNQLGQFTKAQPEIRLVESVLFGTGSGRLGTRAATKALAKGFVETADPAASLCIHVNSHDRYLSVERAIRSGFWHRILDSVLLSPSFFGLGVNLKKLLGIEK